MQVQTSSEVPISQARNVPANSSKQKRSRSPASDFESMPTKIKVFESEDSSDEIISSSLDTTNENKAMDTSQAGAAVAVAGAKLPLDDSLKQIDTSKYETVSSPEQCTLDNFQNSFREDESADQNNKIPLNASESFTASNLENSNIDLDDTSECPRLVLEKSGNSTLETTAEECQKRNAPSSSKIHSNDIVCTKMQKEQSQLGKSVFDFKACMPSRDKIKQYSKRKDEINFENSENYQNGSAEVKERIFREVLEKLTKTSLSIANSRLDKESPILWTCILRVAQPSRQPVLSSVGAYSLRNRGYSRNTKLAPVSADVYDDIDDLPDVEPIREGKDNEWLPRITSKSKKNLPKRSTPQSKLLVDDHLNIETQDSDDDDIFQSKAKISKTAQSSRVAVAFKLDGLCSLNTSAQNRKESANLSLRFDQAVNPPAKQNISNYMRSNSPKFDVPSHILPSNKGEETSDNEVMEIGEYNNNNKRPASNCDTTPRKHFKPSLSNPSSSSTPRASMHTPTGRVSSSSTGAQVDTTTSPITKNTSSPVFGSTIKRVQHYLTNTPVASGSGWAPNARQDEHDLVVVRPGPVNLRRSLSEYSSTPIATIYVTLVDK